MICMSMGIYNNIDSSRNFDSSHILCICCFFSYGTPCICHYTKDTFFCSLCECTRWWRHFTSSPMKSNSCSVVFFFDFSRSLGYNTSSNFFHSKIFNLYFYTDIFYYAIEYFMKESYCNFCMFSIIPTLCSLNSIHLPLAIRVCRSWLLACVWLFRLSYFTGCCGVLVVNIRLIQLFSQQIFSYFSSLHFLSLDWPMCFSISDFRPNRHIQESFGFRVFSWCLIFISV